MDDLHGAFGFELAPFWAYRVPPLMGTGWPNVRHPSFQNTPHQDATAEAERPRSAEEPLAIYRWSGSGVAQHSSSVS